MRRTSVRILATAAVCGLLAAGAAWSPAVPAPRVRPAAPAPAPADGCATAPAPPGGPFYESNPAYLDRRDDSADWRRATPAAQGMAAARLHRAAAHLRARPGMRSLIVLRRGRLVYERYFHGAGPRHSANVHSASKSMLGALLGIAIHRGHLPGPGAPVADYLPGYLPAGSPKRRITVGDLVTMSSGLAWTEDVTEHRVARTADWVRAILGQPYRPGRRFTYSTGNTHVLSAVLRRATGMSTCAFARRYLFRPLRITAERWARDPQGVHAGGFNLYLTPRELAKFGQLYLDGGRWAGRQVVPAATVARSRVPVHRRVAGAPGFGYGAGWWLTRVGGHPMAVAWGWGGQYVCVLPTLRLVVGTTQQTRAAAAAVEARELDVAGFVRRYVLPAIASSES
ncbi:MAG TPA: serine hydrolase [Pilimelia sp.]|nr:serine hydrolase [Pilimelia sp.]